MASVGVVILTLNAERYIRSLMEALKKQTVSHRVLVADSHSADNTVAIAKSYNADILMIPRKEFNHGLTREKARKELGTDIVVFLTQDALPKDETLIEKLIAPLNEASLSYARQLPYPGAGFFETFHREYNYPEKSQLRSIDDLAVYGAYTFFCSNSCSAYISRDLDAIGGFPDVLLGEDTFACATLLKNGKKAAYAADALVYHSHNYRLREEFKRSFDIGYARSKLKQLIGGRQSDEKQGQDYAKTLFIRLMRKPWLLPYAFILLATKWLGYRLGCKGHNLPRKFKIKISYTPYYFYN